MYESAFMEAVAAICLKDPRYNPEAYILVREALDFTAKKIRKNAKTKGRHVSGADLMDGLRKYILREFGPMSLTILNSWGIYATEDFGEIVFNLVESGKLGSTEEDRREDFANGYDFEETFAKPFRPKKTMARQGRGRS